MPRSLLALPVLLLLLATTAHAASLKGGYWACTSKALLAEAATAEHNDDATHRRWLRKNGCIITRAGVNVSDLGSDGFGTRKVRVYLSSGTAVILWTASENVRR